MAISLVVSLTTTPMMCARAAEAARNRTSTDWLVSALQRRDSTGCTGCIRQQPALGAAASAAHAAASLLGTVGLAVYLYVDDSQGILSAAGYRAVERRNVLASRGYFLSRRCGRSSSQYVDIVQSDPAVDIVAGFIGGQERNTAAFNITLKPLAERKVSADQVINRLRPSWRACPEQRFFCRRCRMCRSAAGRQRAISVHAAGRQLRGSARVGAASLRAEMRTLPGLCGREQRPAESRACRRRW